jgi:energy-coupling factor transport system permease protein
LPERQTKSIFLASLPPDSPALKIDPIAKIAVGLGVNLLYFLTAFSLIWGIGEIIFMLSLLIYCKVKLKIISTFLLLCVPLVVSLIIMQSFFRPAAQTIIFSWGPITVYLENFMYGLRLALNLVGSILGTVFILLTNSERDLIYALQKIRIPHFIYLIVGLTLRSLSTFFEDAVTILQAKQSRGLDPKKLSFFQKIKQYASLLVPLIMMEIGRAEHMALSIDSRGFSLRGKRTAYQSSRRQIKTYDYIIIAAVLAVIGFLIINNFLFK